MFRRHLLRTAAGALANALSLGGAATAASPAAADVSVAARTVYHDVSRAGEFATNFHRAAQIWNSSVRNRRVPGVVGFVPTVTHETGSSRHAGLCSDLTSGSGAPVSCRNAYPSAAEAAEVDRRFAGSRVTALAGSATGRTVFTWSGAWVRTARDVSP